MRGVFKNDDSEITKANLSYIERNSNNNLKISQAFKFSLPNLYKFKLLTYPLSNINEHIYGKIYKSKCLK